jgi:hypothetical protein
MGQSSVDTICQSNYALVLHEMPFDFMSSVQVEIQPAKLGNPGSFVPLFAFPG